MRRFSHILNPKVTRLINQSALITTFILIAQFSIAQKELKNTFGKGIKTISKDSTYYVKTSFRVQNRYDGEMSFIENSENKLESTSDYLDRFYIKRGRLKFDGWVVDPKLVYKIEFDIVGGYVRDAIVKWNFYKNFSVWYGLGKLPGNLERVISSQKLQFVDRSILNDAYNIDRDNGVHFRHHFSVGEVYFREALVLSHGSGINDKAYTDGQAYTARLEILPLGKFTKKGEMYYSDMQRESTPKIMLGFTGNFNENARRSKSIIGEVISDSATKNITSVFADLIFKYNGFSVYGEYDFKVAEGSPIALADDEVNSYIGTFQTGTGYNIQASYLFKNNFELALRRTHVRPEDVTRDAYLIATEHTIGASRYIVGHSLKVQSDFALTEYIDAQDQKTFTGVFRFQVELAF